MIPQKKLGSAMIILIGFCFLAALVVSGKFIEQVYATDEIRRNITSYLDEENINYASADVDEGVLEIRLVSSGDDRCTLDDVKAIQAIYEAVHGQTVAEKITDVHIEIYNADNNLIYDHNECNVSSPVEGAELLVDALALSEGEFSEQDILLEVQDAIDGYPYFIEDAAFSSADEIQGDKVELTLYEEDQNVASLSDLNTIYANLEAYSLATGAIAQCEITVFNQENECILYMAGDFEYGNCIAWISPDVEDTFVAQEGPKRDHPKLCVNLQCGVE